MDGENHFHIPVYFHILVDSPTSNAAKRVGDCSWRESICGNEMNQ